MILTLPKPISVNHLYKVTCRRGYPQFYLSNEGKAWFEEAGWIVKTTLKKKKTIEGSVALYVKLYSARTSDLDNIFKATQDLLQKQGIIKNDRQIDFLQGQRIKCRVSEEKIEIELIEE